MLYLANEKGERFYSEMAKNCINNYYNRLYTYKDFRITDKAFQIKYTAALNTCLT